MTRFPQGPADGPGFLLWHVTLVWQRAITAVLQPLELTHVQFVLLASAWWLSRQGQVPNQLELARHAGIDVKMASEVVRRLEAKQLLRREVDAADARAKRLTPTDRGIELAERAVEVVEAVDAEFFGPEASALTPVLQRLAASALGA